ncbi:MAG: class I SAM-dependent methyltransferase, partial [Gemmatimonadota bacterium]
AGELGLHLGLETASRVPRFDSPPSPARRGYLPVMVIGGSDYYDKTPAAAARFDALHATQTDDTTFYVEEARNREGPVLEVGCGTGRVTLAIAEAGVRVVGIDSSAHMLEVAVRKRNRAPEEVRKRIDLVRADMRRFAFRRAFAQVFMPYRVFQSMLIIPDQLAALAAIRLALVSHGRLVFNVFDPRVDLMAGDHHEPLPVQDSGREYSDERGRVRERFTARYDLPAQLVDVTFIYERLDDAGAVVEREFEPLRLRYFYRFEIEHLLQRAGYEVEALYGGWEREPFDRNGQEMIWTVRRSD